MKVLVPVKRVVDANVRVREQWHPVDAGSLAKFAGRRVAVRYVEAGDVKRVESVRVSGKTEEVR